MSKQQIATTIKKELEKVNEEIDMRILRGEPYRRQARQHRALLSQLRHVRSVGRSFSLFSFF